MGVEGVVTAHRATMYLQNRIQPQLRNLYGTELQIRLGSSDQTMYSSLDKSGSRDNDVVIGGNDLAM